MHITYNTAVSEEVSEIRVIAESATVTLIEKFPALKATGLVENWDKYWGHGIYVAYSESGYSVITDFAYAGEFEGHHDGGDGRWEWEYDMMEPVDVRFSRLQANAVEEVHYRYPFRSKWERNYYVREVNGVICAPVTSEEFQIENGVLRGYFGPGGPVHIPDSVTEIEGNLFCGNPLITSVHIPGTVSFVSQSAFEGCTNLAQVILGEGVARIEAQAFENCTALTDVRLPDSLKKIGTDAFRSCSNLDVENLYLPACEEFDVFNPFEGCRNVPDFLCSSDQTILFYTDPQIEQISIPESVRKIHESAFACRQKLSSVKLPSNLKVIGRSAFSGCRNLQEIILPDSLERIEPWAFFGCSSLKEIRIPGSVTVIPEAMLSECTALETVVIEEGVTEIGDFAFAKCKKLKHVSLPGSIRKKIRKKLFEKNPNLVIHGVPGSPAETYAKEKGFRFAANNADTGR
jgi:hypothetical protein